MYANMIHITPESILVEISTFDIFLKSSDFDRRDLWTELREVKMKFKDNTCAIGFNLTSL
ncbi:hypothetical protein GCM10023183_16500 [Nibribacter koreensis]|uniref:Uncharacterized protein n=1 Tax=Nibribacter koreensis TaxID=1084519 RepID=A0ABP8FHL2_9BACT